MNNVELCRVICVIHIMSGIFQHQQFNILVSV